MNPKEILLTKKVEGVNCYETTNLYETYYVLEDGTQISFGYFEGGRTDDHRAIFALFDDIKYNDFKTLGKNTGVVGYIPENNTAWCIKNQKLTKQQQDFLTMYRVEISIE